MAELSGFLSQTFYGNSLMAWSLSLAMILFSSILGKIVYWFFSKVVRAFTRRTKTNLDDIIVDMIEEPIVFAIIVTGIWFALSILVLPEMAASAISHSYSLILAILAGWMASRLFDALYLEYLLPWADKTDNDLDDQLMPILRKGVKMMIWVLAIIIGSNKSRRTI